MDKDKMVDDVITYLSDNYITHDFGDLVFSLAEAGLNTWTDEQICDLWKDFNEGS